MAQTSHVADSEQGCVMGLNGTLPRSGESIAFGKVRTIILAFAMVLALVAPVRASAEDVVHEHLGLKLNGRLEIAPGKSLEKDGVALILHGTLAHHGMEIIRELQANLKQRGINTLAVTLSLGLDRRTGMFDCGVEHDHRHSDAIEELGSWLEWLEARKAAWVDIIGHSRGGAQVALFAAEQGDKVSGRIVLVAPLLENVSAEEQASRYEAQFGKPLEPILADARARAEGDEAESLMDVPGFLTCPSARVSPTAFLDYYAGSRRSVPELLNDIKAPTLVVAAGGDEIIPGIVDALSAAGLPEHVTVSEVDGADHFFRDLFGEDLADEIATFLRRE